MTTGSTRHVKNCERTTALQTADLLLVEQVPTVEQEAELLAEVKNHMFVHEFKPMSRTSPSQLTPRTSWCRLPEV